MLAPHHAAAQGGTAPQITSPPAVTSSPASGDTYGTDETIEFSVTFDAAVTVTGAPRFGFRLKDSGIADSADNFKLAGLVAGGSGTITLRFAYTVQPGDSDNDGISIGTGSRPSGSIPGTPSGTPRRTAWTPPSPTARPARRAATG